MTTTETTTPSASETAAAAATEANPALLGLPTFVVGGLALALYLVGYQPAGSQGSLMAIIVLATGMGQLVTSLWAMRLGAGPVASIFGIFAGFWLTLGTVLYGLGHQWFGATATVPATLAAFTLAWFVVIVVLTLATLRLPLAFTALFGLIDLALLLVFLYANGGGTSTGLLSTAGYVSFLFSLLGIYLFFDAMGTAMGGKPLPVGKPLVKQ
jgi:uncharacterized protein